MITHYMFLSVTFCLALSTIATGHSEEITTYRRREVINDISFEYRHDSVNGKQTEQWLINGKPVGQQDYLEEILEAEKEVRRTQRIEQAARHQREEEYKQEARYVAHKKLLRNQIKDIEAKLQKLDYRNLETYFAFNEQTYSCQRSFNELKEELLPQAHALLDAPDGEHDLAEYQVMLAKLDVEPEKLQELYYATTKHAITVCDDTRKLKELLELI